jgi:hypothetical protein
MFADVLFPSASAADDCPVPAVLRSVQELPPPALLVLELSDVPLVLTDSVVPLNVNDEDRASCVALLA